MSDQNFQMQSTDQWNQLADSRWWQWYDVDVDDDDSTINWPLFLDSKWFSLCSDPKSRQFNFNSTHNYIWL